MKRLFLSKAPFLLLLIFHPKNMGLSLQETPLFFRSSSVEPPSMEKHLSIKECICLFLIFLFGKVA